MSMRASRDEKTRGRTRNEGQRGSRKITVNCAMDRQNVGIRSGRANARKRSTAW